MSPTDRYRRGRPLTPPSPATDSSGGRHPANAPRNRFYADGPSGRFPAEGHNGGRPAEGRSGRYPQAADGRGGEYPADNHNGGYPAGGRKHPTGGRNAADGRSGRYPADGHNGGHLADGLGGRYPAAVGGAGGFSFLRDPVAPAGADPRLWSCFLAVDTDRSGSIDVHELQGALVNGDSTPFDFETVKLLIGLFDANQTGEIDFDEFTRLSRYIEEWRRMFRHFDQDYSGTIDSSELQSALNQFGMKLPPQLVSLLMAKFASLPGSQAGEQTITFDRFIRACVFMKKFKKAFANLDRDKDGWVQISFQQCLKLYLMLP